MVKASRDMPTTIPILVILKVGRLTVRACTLGPTERFSMANGTRA